MAVKSLRCPHCGGVIETFDETMKKGFCPFCDTLIEDVQERQAEMGEMSVTVNKEQNVTTNKVKKSGIIRFIIAIVVLIPIVAYYIYLSTLGGNGEVIGSSSLPFLLCIALFVGMAIGLIIDLIHRKKENINIIFSVCAVAITVITLCSNFVLGSWSYAKYSQNYRTWTWNNEDSFADETTTNVLLPQEEAALKVIEALHSVLKNPDSMQIHSISYCSESVMESVNTMFSSYPDYYGTRYGNIKSYIDCTYLFKINISAQNGFGGMNRETYYISYQSGFVSTQQLDESCQNSFRRLSEEEFDNLCGINIDISKLDV